MTLRYVSGSVGATPKRRLVIAEVATSASPSPIAMPMATGKSLDFHKLDLAHPMSVVSLKSESSQFWESMAVAVIFA